MATENIGLSILNNMVEEKLKIISEHFTKGQIPLGVILAIGGAVGGSVMWVYNLISPVKEEVAEQATSIAVIQEVIKYIPEMQRDLKNTNDNLIKLMASQGVKPVIYLASTTTQ